MPDYFAAMVQSKMGTSVAIKTAEPEEDRWGGSTTKKKKKKTEINQKVLYQCNKTELNRPESKLVCDIVTHVVGKLESLSSCKGDGLIGVYSQLNAVEELLGNGSNDVRLVGIWGICGIGKTAIAGAIFNRLCRGFESYCFLADIRERSKREGLTSLRNELLRNILGQTDINIATPDIGSSIIRDRLCRIRALVVLDDVSDISHLQFLVQEPSYFGPGSRIIITTRDRDVIKNVDEIYSVEGLAEIDALQLFSHHAFKQNHPPEEYLQLSKRVVACAEGIPGFIRTLGLFLGKKTVMEWQSALRRFETSLDEGIYRKLRESYDGLNNEEQKIFLDAACFFKGKERSLITDILNGCEISAEIGIRALIDKSLITFPRGRLQIHNFFEKMARKIVFEESARDPSRRSRLWNYEEVHEVLSENMGTEAIEGISLDLSEEQKMHLGCQAFARMRNLRILIFRANWCGEENCTVYLREGLECLPKSLRWLDWDSFPLKTLPVGFRPENLIELRMRNSCLKRLWEGAKHLVNLKRIDLSHSVHLKEMPDLSNAPRLEHLIARGCTALVSIPTPKTKLRCVELVDLSGCSNLKDFSEVAWNAKTLILADNGIRKLHRLFKNHRT